MGYMKITIDTKEDSATDIRKVIAMLSKMIEDDTGHSNIFEDDSPSLGSSEPSSDSSPTNAFANMFGSSDSDDTPVLPTPSASEDDDSEEEAEEEPQIMEY